MLVRLHLIGYISALSLSIEWVRAVHEHNAPQDAREGLEGYTRRLGQRRAQDQGLQVRVGGEITPENECEVTENCTATYDMCGSCNCVALNKRTATLGESRCMKETIYPCDETACINYGLEAFCLKGRCIMSQHPTKAKGVEATGNEEGTSRSGGTGGDERPPSTIPSQVRGASMGASMVGARSLFNRYVPFDFKIKTFDPQVANGYTNCSELEEDIMQCMKYYADSVILKYSDQGSYFLRGGGGPLIAFADSGVAVDSASEGGEDSYGTNNQKEGVDEADIVKSDGKCVYAAYGDQLVTWDAQTGTEISRTTMPGFKEPRRRRTQRGIGARTFLPPKPKIASLLLNPETNRLVAIVTGYGSYRPYNYENPNILSDNGETQVRIYDTTSCKLQFTGGTDLGGRYQEARSIGSNAHVVTMEYIDMWAHFESHLARWQEHYQGMNDTEYMDAAAKKAEEIMPAFVVKLVDELLLHNNCSSLVQVNMFMTGRNESSGDDGSFIPRDLYSGGGILNAFGRITSFNMDEQFKDLSVSTSVSGLFSPASSVEIYASQNLLVLAARGCHYNSEDWTYKQKTYLMGFHLHEDGTSTPAAVGTLSGHVLNQFSMDDHKGYLRVATTHNAQWSRVEREDLDGNVVWDMVQTQTTENEVVILRVPSIEDGSNVTEMEEVGSIENLGKKDERIFSVRFIGDLGFIVTFRQTDPFYTLNLTDPTEPFVVGELNVTGFSNYLHPINKDNSLILAVGQEADEETGRPLSLQISLFDVKNLAKPKLASRYVVEESDDIRSYSNAQYDHKAFRYLEQSKRLILPASMRGEEYNFDGFFIYDISEKEIKPRFNVSHVNQNTFSGCWYPARLYPRSMVFDGKVTTMKGHTVQSHDLETGDELWELNLDAKLSKEDVYECYGWWLR